jgi:ATP phosphoribosyltransferase
LTIPGWLALEIIIEEEMVKKILPQLKRAGAEGIIEYPLNKVIY